MAKRILALVVVALLLSGMMISGSLAASAGPKELVYGQVNMQAVMDRQITTYLEAEQICKFIYEGLLYNDPFTGTLEPRLAESYEVSDDGLVWTFNLRKGVTFHDGSAFTADDVKFTYERVLNPDTGALIAEDYEAILGAQDMLDGVTTELEGLKIIDDYTVEITLAEPFAVFGPYSATLQIYPRGACTEAGDDWGWATMIGTGPFMLDEHMRDIGLRMTKYDGYWGVKPIIDSVYWKWYDEYNTMFLDYEAGVLDSLILDAAFIPQYKNSPDFQDQLTYFSPYGHFFIIFNFEMDPWKDNPKAREAFSYAMDTTSICEDLFDGNFTAASCLLTPDEMGANPSAPKAYDPEKAKALLAEAGYPDGIDIEMITTSLEGTGGKMIIAIQETAAAAGIRITATQVDRAVWTEIRNGGQVQCFVANWYLDINDPDGILYGFFHSNNNPYFSSLYKSDVYDGLITQARRTTDGAARAELYRQADALLVEEDFVTVPIAWPNTFYFVAPWLVNFQTEAYTPNLIDCDIDLAAQPAR